MTDTSGEGVVDFLSGFAVTWSVVAGVTGGFFNVVLNILEKYVDVSGPRLRDTMNPEMSGCLILVTVGPVAVIFSVTSSSVVSSTAV